MPTKDSGPVQVPITVPADSLVIPEAHLRAIIFEQVSIVFKTWADARVEAEKTEREARMKLFENLELKVDKWSWICVGILVALIGTGGLNAIGAVLKISAPIVK